MALTLTTWNVNSVRKRLDGLRDLIEAEDPDVICLQETKVQDHLFPATDIAAMGYPHQAIHGMKGYNGVALLSRYPLDAPDTLSWCGKEDCRHLFANIGVTADGGVFDAIEVHSLYIPAGGDVADPIKNPKFRHKLDFFDAQTHWWQARGWEGPPRVLMGDFNVAPLETDVWSHERLKNVVTHTPVEIAALYAFQQAGRWTDAVRKFIKPDVRAYTWWSYRAADWEAADKGRRLDHAWVSPDLAPLLDGISILKDARNWAPPSDHAPVTLRIGGVTPRG